MTLHRLPDGSVQVANLDEWHLQVLRSIPSLASAGDNEKAKQRLFPRPFSPAETTEENFEDWEEFVRPELEALFSGSLQHVAQDLDTAGPSAPEAESAPATPEEFPPPEMELEPEPAPAPAPAPAPKRKRRKAGLPPPAPVQWEFRIPAAHVEDWFRAMNQARLMLSAKHEAHRTDNAHIASMFISGKMETLIQYELLTGLCSWWVEVLLNR